MANQTIAEQIAELEDDRVLIRASLTAARTGADVAGFTSGDLSVQRARIDSLQADLTRIDKSLQRLYRGGRGMPMDMSSASGGDDPYRSGSEVLL